MARLEAIPFTADLAVERTSIPFATQLHGEGRIFLID